MKFDIELVAKWVVRAAGTGTCALILFWMATGVDLRGGQLGAIGAAGIVLAMTFVISSIFDSDDSIPAGKVRTGPLPVASPTRGVPVEPGALHVVRMTFRVFSVALIIVILTGIILADRQDQAFRHHGVSVFATVATLAPVLALIDSFIGNLNRRREEQFQIQKRSHRITSSSAGLPSPPTLIRRKP